MASPRTTLPLLNDESLGEMNVRRAYVFPGFLFFFFAAFTAAHPRAYMDGSVILDPLAWLELVT